MTDCVKPYKLIIERANVSSMLWARKLINNVYRFETVEELVSFVMANIPIRPKDIDMIYERNKSDKHNLANTSWYVIEKSEHQMTEYTSL